MTSDSEQVTTTLSPIGGQPQATHVARGSLTNFARRTNKKAAVGVAIIGIMILLALLAPVLAPGDPQLFSATINEPPSWNHLLGTNGNGQDVLSQLLWGARISLSVAAGVALLTTAIGLVVGMSAAYFGGLGDELISLVINIVLVIPALPLLVILASFLRPGVTSLIIVLSATGWAWGARVIRAQALRIRHMEFVAAARIMGERPWRIVVVEMLPNMWSLIVAYVIGSAIFAIAVEAALEFLGLGDLHNVTWGVMLNTSGTGEALLRGTWWTFMPPGLVIAVTAFALALINYSMDEVTNPQLRTSSELRALRRKHRSLRHARVTPVVPSE